MGHIDDSLLVGQSFDSFRRNIAGTVGLFTNLGFTIHPVKSVLQPQRQILGFALSSITMTVTLTDAKVMKVKFDIDLFASRLNFKVPQYVMET